MIDYFTFDGVDSRLFNVYLHDTSNARLRNIISTKANTTDKVLGRSGEILFDQQYEPKSIKLNTFADGSQDEVNFRELATLFGRLGQKKLVLSYEPYKYHNATYSDAIIASEYSGGSILNEVNFIAYDPFGYSTFTTSDIVSGLVYDSGYYYDSGLLYYEDMTPYSYSNIVSGNSISIYHGGNCDYAYPVFKFTGACTSLKVEQYSDATLLNKINEFSYGAFNGTLNVDCNVSNVFKNGVMSNASFAGNFMNLYGVTSYQYQNIGDIKGISSNTITLSTLASSVNDYYNGMSIYWYNSATQSYEKRVITDYVGATKVATLSSAFTNAVVGDGYKIYNLVDGKNYFKITGTGFSSLGLTVDFRYVYL